MVVLSAAASTGDGSVHSDTVPSASPDTSRPGPSQAIEVTGCGVGSVAMRSQLARLQMITPASDVPAAMDVPSGLNASVLTQSVAPVSVPSWLAVGVSAASVHSHTLSSWLAAARVCPSRLNATAVTMDAGPVSGMP